MSTSAATMANLSSKICLSRLKPQMGQTQTRSLLLKVEILTPKAKGPKSMSPPSDSQRRGGHAPVRPFGSSVRFVKEDGTKYTQNVVYTVSPGEEQKQWLAAALSTTASIMSSSYGSGRGEGYCSRVLCVLFDSTRQIKCSTPYNERRCCRWERNVPRRHC
jgi:hypothetical protein